MYKIIPIIHMLSKLGLPPSMLLLVSTLMSYFSLDSTSLTFIYTVLVTTIGSYTAWVLTLRFNRELRPRDGFTLVPTLWLASAAVTAIPIYFYISNTNFTDVLFEAVSGLTTTGSTAMNSLDTLAPSVNFWRHMLNQLGGIGIVVLAVTILPMLDVGGTQLFKVEIPGMGRESKMAPRVSQVAEKLWFSYTLTTAAIFVSLHLMGMSWPGTLCHTMSAVALDGFSTRDDNTAYFSSVSIEWVLIFLTVFNVINFISYSAVSTNRLLKMYWRDKECRVLLSILSGSVVVSAVHPWYMECYPSLADSIRFTAFNFVSVGLASGLPNADSAKQSLMILPQVSSLLNVLAGSDSMDDGIKNMYGLVVFKFNVQGVMASLHPRVVRTVKVNGHSIQERMVSTVMSFISIYFMTVVILSLLTMVAGLDFLSAFIVVTACITNAGSGLGAVGPEYNYAVLSDVQEWLYTTVMLLERLEIFTVLILFTPAYWKR